MPPRVICCGLSCVDMQLHSCEIPRTQESITKFANVTFTAGGSAPQTARALASLSVPTSALTIVGADPHGSTMRELLVQGGVDPSALIVDPSSCTSLAVLPLFKNGTRGCFVTLGANLDANVSKLLTRTVLETSFTASLRVFHFGYPHLMPNLQGQNLRSLFDRVREAAPNALLTVDVNGADVPETSKNPILMPGLDLVAAIHANLEEACIITGLSTPAKSSSLTAKDIHPIAQWFSARGAGVVFITCGKDGVFAATGGSAEDEEWAQRLRLSPSLERGRFIYRPAYKVTDGVTVNASGAGDAFIAGVISELATNAGKGGIVRLMDAGLVGALHRIDSSFSEASSCDMSTLLHLAKDRARLPCRSTLCPEEFEVAT